MAVLAIQTPFRPADLDRVEDLGVDAVQLRVGPGFPVDTADPGLAEARAAADELARRGLKVVALGYYRNHLSPDQEERRTDLLGLRNALRMTELFETDLVGAFCGRHPELGEEANFSLARELWEPLVPVVEELGVRVAFENCTLRKGDPPRSLNLCSTPFAYRRLFEILPSRSFGIELDPSHLHRQRIDPVGFVDAFADRILHVHAKDHEHLPDVLRERGCLDPRSSRDRLPGRGEIDWTSLGAALARAGFRGAVTLEVERDGDGLAPPPDEIVAAVGFLRRWKTDAGLD